MPEVPFLGRIFKAINLDRASVAMFRMTTHVAESLKTKFLALVDINKHQSMIK